MKSGIYVYRDLINEQSSDFVLLERNDKAALRRFKHYCQARDERGNLVHNPDEWQLLNVGTYDRDEDKGVFIKPRIVEETVAPGTIEVPTDE